MSKTIKTRSQQKIDTSTNWAKATSFVPLKGEVIVYSDLNKIKIGDGSTVVGSLPFLNANVASYAEASAKAANDGDGNQITATYLPKSKVVSKGSATNPVYFDSTGEAKATTYSLNKTVPNDAVFTDTKNTAGATTSADRLYLIGATSETENPQTYSNGIYAQMSCLYTYSIWPIDNNSWSLGDASHKWNSGYFTRLHPTTLYTTAITTDMDAEGSLSIYAGNTITFGYSGYVGAQSYIDVPHGKGTSSAHDKFACVSDLSSLADEDELPEMVTSISATYAYNDNVEITEIYLQFEMMDSSRIEGSLVLMGVDASFASAVSVYYNHMGVKTAATLQGSTLPSSGFQLYEVNLTRNDSNNTVSFAAIPTNDPASFRFNKKYNGSDIVYFYGSNTGGWNAVTDSDIANLSLYSKKTHKHTFTGTSKAVSVSGQYAKATGVTINPITPSGSVSLTAGTAPSLSSSSSSSSGALPYVTSVSGGTASGTTKYFHPSFTGASGNISASYTPSGSVSLTRSQDVALTTGSVNSLSSAGSGSLTSSDTSATGDIAYVSGISSTPASGTSTAGFVKGISGGSGSLTSNTTATDGIKYTESVSYSTPTEKYGYIHFSAGTTPVSSASFSGTAGTATGSFTPSGSVSLTRSADVALNTSSVNSLSSAGSGSLISSDTSSTGDIAYVSGISSTGASASGTATFVKTINGGSGSLTSNTTASGGTAYVESISSTPASGTVKYMSFNPGVGSTWQQVSDLRKGGTTATGVTISGTVTDGVLELSAATSSAYLTGTSTTSVNSITGNSLPSLDFNATSGNAYVTAVSGGTASAATKYLHHTHTGASAGTTGTAVTGVTGGTASATTKYLRHTHTSPTSSSVTVATGVKTQPSFTGSFTGTAGTVSASYTPSGSVSLSRGTAPSLTADTTPAVGATIYMTGINPGSLTSNTKYLHHTHTGASVSSTGSAITAVSGGSASATTKYLHHTHTAPTSSAATVATGVSKQPTFTGSFAGTAGTATGSFTPSGSVSLGSNSTASGGVAYTESVSSTGASGATAYLKLNAGTTPPKSASFTGTAITPTGTISTSNVSMASSGTYTPEGTLSSATE